MRLAASVAVSERFPKAPTAKGVRHSTGATGVLGARPSAARLAAENGSSEDLRGLVARSDPLSSGLRAATRPASGPPPPAGRARPKQRRDRHVGGQIRLPRGQPDPATARCIAPFGHAAEVGHSVLQPHHRTAQRFRQRQQPSALAMVSSNSRGAAGPSAITVSSVPVGQAVKPLFRAFDVGGEAPGRGLSLSVRISSVPSGCVTVTSPASSASVRRVTVSV
jgi:hypothetical protein